MLGLHSVLVKRHGRFTFSIEIDKIRLVTLNTIFSVNFVTTRHERDDSNTKSKGHDTSKSHNP
jgi:hypothetical protein